MKRNLFVHLGALLLLCGLPAAVAHADSVELTLSNPAQSVGTTGGTLEVFATITASSSNTGDVFLNGDSYSVTGASLDDSPFFNNFPLSLAPGESFTGELFDVSVAPGTALGEYDGIFTVLGGADSNTYDNLASSSFTVNVTPEPSTFLLLGSSVIGAAFALRKRLHAMQATL